MQNCVFLKRVFLTIILSLFILSACTTPGEPPPLDCSSDGFTIIPTPIRQTDPDLFSPPIPPDGGDGAEYCPTPIPAETPVGEFPEQFITTEVVNLSLDMDNQDLAATAVGDDMIAVAWLIDGDIYVALSRGGNHFQVRRVDSGSNVALVFSAINRLHVVYEQDGQIFYRAADQGVHPANVEGESVAYGTNPTVVLNQFHYAQIIYEDGGTLYHAAHMMTGQWQIGSITEGTQPALVGFGNDLDMGYIVAYRLPGGDIQLVRWLTSPYGFFPVWQPVAQINLPLDEEMTGPVGLDYLAVSEEEAWVVASWVSKRPFPEPPLPLYAQPIYEAANPLYPNQIANPNHIYAGLNAVRWRTEDAPFDAGLRQTIHVPDTNGTIILDAWGLAETVTSTEPVLSLSKGSVQAVGAELSLRIGIDPTGGDNPDSPDVVWSDAVAPTDFTQLSVTVPAQGSSATVFLRGTLDTTDIPGTAVWDSATTQNGSGVNLDFEGSFVLQDSITVPDGWTAWYQDSGNAPTGGRDVYTVYAAWSDNGGSVWTGPEAITANRDLSGGTTGAIRPDVTPVISMATEPPSVSFFYIYETGDPPPDTTFLRFGRPYQTQCDLGTADCTDTPGTPLMPRNVVRPSTRLLVAADPFNPDRAILTWDSLQTDALNKDVYATYTVLR